MSCSSLYVADSNLKFYPIKEYSNGWGTFPRIWDYYFTFLGSKEPYSSWMTDEGFFEKLNKKLGDKDFGDNGTPLSEALTIFSTYHPVLFHRSTWELLLKGFEDISKKLDKLHPDHVNHYPQIINDIKSLDDSTQYITIKGTSCDDNYEYWNEETDSQFESLNDLAKCTGYLKDKIYDKFDLVYLENNKIVIKKIKDL